VDIPTDAMEFDLKITPPASKPGKNSTSAACNPTSPTATPNAKGPNAKGKANPRAKATKPSVLAACNIQRVVPAREWIGTASNTQLAALDAGFNNGTFTARCNSQRRLSMALILMQPNAAPRLVKDPSSNVAFTACKFTISFTDAQSSSFTGTIKVAIKIGTDAGIVVDNKITVNYSAMVDVNEGTGAFAGHTGTGSYSPAQTIELIVVRGGAGANAARLRATVVRSVLTSEKMTLTFQKSATS
jgi:hypothetical protein